MAQAVPFLTHGRASGAGRVLTGNVPPWLVVACPKEPHVFHCLCHAAADPDLCSGRQCAGASAALAAARRRPGADRKGPLGHHRRPFPGGGPAAARPVLERLQPGLCGQLHGPCAARLLPPDGLLGRAAGLHAVLGLFRGHQRQHLCPDARLQAPDARHAALVLGLLLRHHGLLRPDPLLLEQSLRDAVARAAGRQRPQSPAAEPRHDLPPAAALPGLRRLHRARLSCPGPEPFRR